MTFFQSSQRRVDIVFTISGIYTLANLVIIDLIRANLVSCVTYSQGMAMTIVAQAKIVSYHN